MNSKSESPSRTGADDYPISERLLSEGATFFTNAELLAAIFVTGTTEESALQLAERMISAQNGLHGLARASINDLRQVTGLAPTNLAQIIATFELSKRLSLNEGAHQTAIHSTADAIRSISDMAYLRQENVRVILLDSSRHVIGLHTVYIGTINTSVLRVSEIFRDAVLHNSPAIILAHNHPSGDPSPSPEDIAVTRAIANAGRLLDIVLLDHIIMGYQRWVSLRDLGFTF